MAGLNTFYVIKPLGTTNMIRNPSFEFDINNWSLTVDANPSQVRDESINGDYSCLFALDGVGASTIYATATLTASVAYVFSVYVRAVDATMVGRSVSIFFSNTSNTVLGSAVNATLTLEWQRIQVSYTPGTTSVRLQIKDNATGAAGVTGFYVDAAQLEVGTVATTYCDGDIPGCHWTSVPHSSTSVRPSNLRSGGEKVYLTTYKAYVKDVSGIGQAPVENIIQNYATQPGGQFHRQNTRPRTLLITLSVNGDDSNNWDDNMRRLWDLIKPDTVLPQQPFILGYDGNTFPVEIPCVADGDVSLQSDKLKEISDVAIRATAFDPFWLDIGRQSELLTSANASLAGVVSGTARRGYAQITATGLATAAVIKYGNRRIYVGDNYTTINGVSANRIAEYDGSAFAALSTGLSGGTGLVDSIAVAPNGDVYVAGGFASPFVAIARWNGSSWNAVGTSTGSADDLVFDSQGRLLATGSNVGSLSAGLGRWDGSSWAAVFTNITTWAGSSVACIATLGDIVYIGSSNSNIAGSGVGYIGKVIGSTLTAMGTLNGTVATIAVGPDGYIYAGGTFTTADGVTVNRIARHNGTAWEGLGTGANGTQVVKLIFDNDGVLWMFGDFTTVNGELGYAGVACYKNGKWFFPGVSFTGTENNVDVIPGQGILFHSPTIAVAAVTAVSNRGSAPSFPIITIVANANGTKATRIELFNQMTGGKIALVGTLGYSERITIDLRPGKSTISSNMRADAYSLIGKESNLDDFILVGGTNNISCWTSTSNVTVSMSWRPHYWGAHGHG